MMEKIGWTESIWQNRVYVLKEDEYRNEKGVLMCKHCNTARASHIRFGNAMVRCRHLCRCQMEKRNREDAEWKERELRDTIARNRSIGLTDPVSRKHTFALDEGYNPEGMIIAQSYVDHWEEMRENAQGLLFWGSCGTGKTFLAECIGNALVEKGVTVMITSFPQLLNKLSDFKDQDRSRIVEELNRYELLILDDLGAERDSEFVQEQCFHIVDSRYRSSLPMIITTNYFLQDMKSEENLGKKRIFDRILEHTTPVCVDSRNVREIRTAKNMAAAKSLLLP